MSTVPGSFKPEHVFEYYDEPVLFTVRDEGGRPWLVVLVDSEADYRKWLRAPLSEQRLKALVAGDIDFRTAFLNVEGGHVFEGEEYRLPVSDLTEDHLPEPFKQGAKAEKQAEFFRLADSCPELFGLDDDGPEQGSFKQALKSAEKTLDLIGTGKIRTEELHQEGPRTYGSNHGEKVR